MSRITAPWLALGGGTWSCARCPASGRRRRAPGVGDECLVVTEMTSVQSAARDLDNSHVLASVVFRHVRTPAGPVPCSPHVSHARRASARTGPPPLRVVVRSERPTVARRAPDSVEAWQEMLVTGLAELACRQVHALTVTEKRREHCEDPTHAL